LAIVAANGSNQVVRTDAYLYCNMGDNVDIVYIRPPDWWPEPVPEGHVFLLLKSNYCILQAASKWHIHISTWMQKSGYLAVKSEKTSLP
jgi:hypothetical protein